MKVKKKVIIPIITILAVGAAAVYAVSAATGGPQIKMVDTYKVERTDLSNNISVTGIVESEHSTNVYTTLSYPVEQVEVEVGDQVREGDILCRLDTAALEYTIAQTQASLASAQAKAGLSVQMAEKGLEKDPENVEIEYDIAIENAKSAILSAENNLKAQQHRVADLRQDIRDLRDDKLQVPDGSTYDDYITAKQKELVQAEIALENAQLTLEDANTNLETQEEQKRRKVEQTADAGKDSVTSAQLNANMRDQQIALEKLEKDLANATITAPVSGTVTAVYAKEGAVGSGLLLVIEDTKSLKITTKIKEYDIGMVEEGMKVTIKTDATGDEVFTGVVSKIFPTAQKDAAGNTVDTSNVEFPAEIKVDPGSKLRIGMNARLNIITGAREGVLTVPYEAIGADDDGNTFVFVMDTREDGTKVARKVMVTPGMETDFSSEILESELEEGELVITSAEGLEDGMAVFWLDAAAADQSAAGRSTPPGRGIGG